jgi:hypothetical protein
MRCTEACRTSPAVEYASTPHPLQELVRPLLDLQRDYWIETCRRTPHPDRNSFRMYYGPEFVSRKVDLWALMRGVTLDFSRLCKPPRRNSESLNGKLRAESLSANWFSGSTRRGENARLDAETKGRCARRARLTIKCLRRFIGRLAIPASPPPDEAGRFRCPVSKVGKSSGAGYINYSDDRGWPAQRVDSL